MSRNYLYNKQKRIYEKEIFLENEKKMIKKNNVYFFIKNNQDYLDNIEVKLILFYSQGQPYDNSIDLTDAKNIMIETYNKEFDEIIVYTPSILRDLGYDYLCNEYDDFGVIIRNKEQKNIGFSKWKPLILKLELLKSSSNTILVYHDVDCIKYPIYSKFTEFRNTALYILHKCNYDFFLPQEHERELKYLCKNTVLLELGKDKKFNYEFSQVCANFIIVKNTSISMCMLDEWLECCKNERWINGISYYKEYPFFLAHCPEQSIINNIIANWIQEKKHNINEKFPVIYLIKRNINDYCEITNYNYLKYLKS